MAASIRETEEGKRLFGDHAGAGTVGADWRRWGPYLSDRQWGTVREDYSPDGDAWDYLPHDHARSRAYRWGEDGIAGFCDADMRWCLSLALWNGADPILKERFFGLTNQEGNHGEDVKELYYHLDGLPSHALMRMLYKYPQAAFPYDDLLAENGRRGLDEPEYELLDTGIFAEKRYFDVEITYAKAAPDDVLMAVRVINRGPQAAQLHVLPQLWARNLWSFGRQEGGRPELVATSKTSVSATHPELLDYELAVEDGATLIFCDNETNDARLSGAKPTGFPKDAFHERVVAGREDAVNPTGRGTKCAAWHRLDLGPGEEHTVRLRFRKVGPRAGAGAATDASDPFADFDAILEARTAEADAYYAALQAAIADPERRRVQRQALAGLLWSKQFYGYDLREWLAGDPGEPPPPETRRDDDGRNTDWRHVRANDIISMPDAWEYPWFASWDLALQALPFALIDPAFAKDQLLLLCRDRYMHPSGQIPAYEWDFSDANPPLQAMAALRVYEMDAALTGSKDRAFLEEMFQRLTINFTWWVNRKDAEGRNLFQGGFLGLDNIEIIDRSKPLPEGWRISQSDGTAWMAAYALHLMAIATELAADNPVYEGLAAKFFEHFLLIAAAAAQSGGLWDEADQFYYDRLDGPDGAMLPLKARSLVGLIPLCAVTLLDQAALEKLPRLSDRIVWFSEHRRDLCDLVSRFRVPGQGGTRLFSMVRAHRMRMLLDRMLDASEFLSPHGLRAVSKVYEANPFTIDWRGAQETLPYWPAESRSRLFGGNSNWRGPVWMPINYLLVDALRRFGRFYGDGLTVGCPDCEPAMDEGEAAGESGTDRAQRTLAEVADRLSERLIALFLPNGAGHRPVHGGVAAYADDPAFRDLVLFYEYFDGDTGRGVGAAHQTGWSALVALLIAETVGAPKAAEAAGTTAAPAADSGLPETVSAVAANSGDGS